MLASRFRCVPEHPRKVLSPRGDELIVLNTGDGVPGQALKTQAEGADDLTGEGATPPGRGWKLSKGNN